MEEPSYLDPTLPHHRENNKPPIPKKMPLETEPGSIILGDRPPTYSLALKNRVTVSAEPTSPSSISEELDEMGFTKVDLPAPENGAQNQGPRQPLPKGLVSNRAASHSSSHQPPRPPRPPRHHSPGASLHSRELPKQDFASKTHRGEDGVDSGQELRLYREIDELRRQLKSTATRAEIAEEKAEKMEQRIDEIKNTMSSSFSEVEKGNESLASSLKRVKEENSTLTEQLRDAQSHIFSLQPYRKELTPEEVGREYDDLVEGIADWVSKFMAPFLDDHEKGVDDIISIAYRKPTDATKLKRVIHVHPDLIHGSMYPETDEDLVIAIILRYLNDNIFQRILYGLCTNSVEVLSFVETALQNHVEPKRDLFTIRTWTAEAYNAILSTREFRGLREKKAREFAAELAGIFKILCRKDKLELFYKNFETQCVRPAMQLYEKIQVSTHHFYFDVNPYIMWGPDGDMQTLTEFFDKLQTLDCKNILQNRKAFSLAKMDPPPTKKELYHQMLNICTLTPALYMRQIGRKDVIREPQLVRRQQMLVAWGSQEKRRRFQEDGERTLLNHLYCANNDRERREAGGWSPFRWGN